MHFKIVPASNSLRIISTPRPNALAYSASFKAPLNCQPVLSGQLVALRPLQAEDWDALFAVASDPLIWEQHPANDRWQEPVFRAFFQQGLDCGGALLALDAQTGEVIGSSRFDNYDPEAGEVEIGWTFLARSRWGGPHNAEMKRLMLDHAFQSVDRVMFSIGAENWRSRKAVEKLGAFRAPERDDPKAASGVRYQITAQTWRRKAG
jgi:RimJ/RimL family protein N-acetyltransferase